jgi:hypothetical protein
MKIAVSYSQNKNSKKAGEEIAKKVVKITGQPDLIILYTTEFFNQEDVIAGVKKIVGNAKIIGCCAAGIITKDGVFKDAVGIMSIKSNTLKCITDIEINVSKNARNAGIRAGEKLIKSGEKEGTILVLPDGFASNIAEIVKGLYHIIGADYEYIGGGTGDNLKFYKSYQFNEKKLASDALAVALISGIKLKTRIGHGWTAMGDPLLISKTNGKKIIKIDGKPAFQAYTKYFKDITSKNFSYYGMMHPLGLPNIESEYIIRDPVKVNDDGSIDCVTEVPENSMVHIMNGNKKILIKAAHDVAKNAVKNFKNPKFVWIFDCISRYVLLGDDYKHELDEIIKTIGKDVPLLGILTFGEVGGRNDGPPLFHNKTLVITLGK